MATKDDEPRFVVVRTQSEVYAEYFDGEKEYYDLDADPHQLAARRTRRQAFPPDWTH